MSDVTVSVVENTTSVVVSNDVVEINVVESPVTISTGVSGPQGASGVGYTGVTSTSTITIGSGLKTFTLVSGYQGAFVTGMRVRAIHSDTPTYYLEGTANYIGGGTLIITVDKFNGSGSHNLWAFSVAGEVGQTGAIGSSGVVSVTSPITNTGTAGSAIVGIDQTLLSLTRSQISDFTSGTVTSISGTVTQSQVTSLVTDLANRAVLNAANTFSVGGHVINTGAVGNKGLVVKGTASQSSNLQEWQDTGGTVLSQITAGGQFVSPQRMTIGLTALSTVAQLVVASPVDRVTMAVRGVASQSANLQEWQNSAGTVLSNITSTGVIRSTLSMQALGMQSVSDGSTSMAFSANRNVQIGATTGVYGGGTGVIGITNASGTPTSNPTGGGILYVEAGALKYRGSSGTITTLGAA